jgi:cell division protein FtsB
MHISGKIAAWLVVIVAIVGAVFTSKVVQVRSSWTAKSLASQKKYEDLKPQIEKLEVEIDALKKEIFLAREHWGKAWDVVPTEIAPDGSGTVEIGIGTQTPSPDGSGPVQDKMVLHGWQPLENGEMINRGSFLVVAANPNSCTLKPTNRVSAEEVRTWQPGQWRWRNMMPEGYAENFDKQLAIVFKLEETLYDRKKTLDGQIKLLAQANDELKVRESELVGGDGLSKAQFVEPEFREGLVAAVTTTEEARNKTLQSIDELRREVRHVQNAIEKLQKENNDLADRLPKPRRSREVADGNR